MTQEAKIILGITLASIIILVGGVFFLSKSNPPAPESAESKNLLMNNIQHKISTDSAKVTVVEFADFQCPACGQAHPALKQVIEDYRDQLTFIYRHYPLPQHRNAETAAKAAEAAGEQGKFWEMHTVLFQRQTEWSEEANAHEIFQTYAKELQLDEAKFKADLESTKYDARIQQDKSDANGLGIQGTPTIFINGHRFTEAPSLANLKKTIDAELKK